MRETRFNQILVTGGAGYVGAVLVPKLLSAGYRVRVLDWYLYGKHVLDAVKDHPGLDQVQGDIRDLMLVRQALKGCDAVIHLACISNDPSFELNPLLGRSVNFDSFQPLVDAAVDAGVRRFIYASSSSVYGVSDAEQVDESHPLRPLTDYSRYKAMCEPILLDRASRSFTPVVIRPATLCGYSPRQRLDLAVNILTSHAVNVGTITVFGGAQKRPNLHVDDMADLYVRLLSEPDDRLCGEVFNVGCQNHTMSDIAQIVRGVVAAMVRGREQIEIRVSPTDDIRSYHISSQRIQEVIGFVPRRTLQDAVRDLVSAFGDGRLPNPTSDPKYFNIRMMQLMESKLAAA
jgi:nucleoside-diphosphate-sugar epimerase